MAETIIIALQAIETLDELCENAICSQKKYDNNDKEVLVGRLSEQDYKTAKRYLDHLKQLPEQPYEGCMAARVIKGVEGEEGTLLIRFPIGLHIGDLPLHTHQFSRRRILMYEGEGEYHVVDKKENIRNVIKLKHGDIVDFAKGVIHTFIPQDGQEMLVYAKHNPFQLLDDENILTREDCSKLPKRARTYNSSDEYASTHHK